MRNNNRAATQVTHASHRFQKPLSDRLRKMADAFDDVLRYGRSFEPRDMERIVQQMRECSRSARRLEGAPSGPTVNIAVPRAFEALHRAERAIATARIALRERLEQVDIDPSGKIEADIAEGIAYAESARSLIQASQAVDA